MQLDKNIHLYQWIHHPHVWPGSRKETPTPPLELPHNNYLGGGGAAALRVNSIHWAATKKKRFSRRRATGELMIYTTPCAAEGIPPKGLRRFPPPPPRNKKTRGRERERDAVTSSLQVYSMSAQTTLHCWNAPTAVEPQQQQYHINSNDRTLTPEGGCHSRYTGRVYIIKK